MRPDFGHKQNKSYEQRIREAKDWAERVGLSGPLLADDDSFPLLRFGKGVIPSWARAKKGRTKPSGWGYMYVLNRRGQIVYQHGHDTAFRYHQTRFILDRLLDPEFDEAFRRGFPGKNAGLPETEDSRGGVTSIDRFESYRDSYDFKLQPRWGFGPDTQNMIEKFAGLAVGKGRKGSSTGSSTNSTAAVVTGRAPRGMHNIEHRFARPLADGYLRFYVRRGPSGWNKRRPQRVMAATVYGAARKEVGTIEVHGVWEEEVFKLSVQPETGGEPGQPVVKLSKGDWHEVVIRVATGSRAVVTIDGRAIGELPAGPIDRIGFDCGHHGFFLDDVELFYAKTGHLTTGPAAGR